MAIYYIDYTLLGNAYLRSIYLELLTNWKIVAFEKRNDSNLRRNVTILINKVVIFKDLR